MFIYLIVNHTTGKYYVGQHKGNNLKKYLQDKFAAAKRKTSGTSRLFNAMREHTDHAIWSIHALLSDIQTRPELDAIEKDFISFLRSQDPEYGYNICRGGEGFTGPHTEQWKEKMRVRMKGRTFTPEAIARMKASPKTEVQLANLNRKGFLKHSKKRKVSPEGRAKLSAAHIGRGIGPKPQWVKDKISTALKGKSSHPAVNVVDMIGQFFNGIEVLERVGSKGGKATWSCRCVCGKIFTVSGGNLRNGHTHSCGCLNKIFKGNQYTRVSCSYWV